MGNKEATTLLVINGGSSSIKLACYKATAQAIELLAKATLKRIGQTPQLAIEGDNREMIEQTTLAANSHYDNCLTELFNRIRTLSPWCHVEVITHRIVHGGDSEHAACEVTPELLEKLERLTPFVPLHQPQGLLGIRVCSELFAELPQYVCFDTAFHRSLPDREQYYALPYKWFAHGLRRYGFHGLSYEWITSVLPQYNHGKLPERLVIAHLGSGASLCALRSGKSIATTMGCSALDGLPMGTRCGQLDPGAVLYLLEQGHMNTQQLRQLLHQDSGLLGISGVSNDVEVLMQSKEPRAQQALDIFVYRVQRELGAMAASLGGIDGLVFTGGIGENEASIRQRICEQAAWLGIEIDPQKNDTHEISIHRQGHSLPVWVIPCDEEKMMAQHTYNHLK